MFNYEIFDSNEVTFKSCLLNIFLYDLISSTKALYYENLAKKLNNQLLLEETYWSILKTIYSDQKIPLIPPLSVDNKFVTDIKTKANIFNDFFCRAIYTLEKQQRTYH